MIYESSNGRFDGMYCSKTYIGTFTFGFLWLSVLVCVQMSLEIVRSTDLWFTSLACQCCGPLYVGTWFFQLSVRLNENSCRLHSLIFLQCVCWCDHLNCHLNWMECHVMITSLSSKSSPCWPEALSSVGGLAEACTPHPLLRGLLALARQGEGLCIKFRNKKLAPN